MHYILPLQINQKTIYSSVYRSLDQNCRCHGHITWGLDPTLPRRADNAGIRKPRTLESTPQSYLSDIFLAPYKVAVG